MFFVFTFRQDGTIKPYENADAASEESYDSDDDKGEDEDEYEATPMWPVVVAPEER